jgi:hypothetical protein
MPDLEGHTRYQPRGGAFADYAGPLWRFSCERVRHALDADIPTLDACESWLSGALLIECLPSVLLILARHGHDPREALLHAVNDTYDNDTVAAIVGAAVGALHGREALPERWISGLTGRTRDSDDGRIFAILDQARGAFRKGMPLA